MPELIEEVLRHGVYWLDYWLLFNLAGLIVISLCMASGPMQAEEGVSTALARSWRLLLILYAINTVPVLLLDIMELADKSLPASAQVMMPVLTESYFGKIWAIRITITLALASSIFWFRFSIPGRGWVVVASLGLVGLSFTYSATSHAANQGNFTVLQLTHWIHLIAVMAWAGSVLGAFQYTNFLLKSENGVSLYGGGLKALSRVAAIAFIPAIAGGIYAAWWLLAGSLNLLEYPYSRSLATKLLFVMGMLLLAARLRVVYIPQLARVVDSGAEIRRRVHELLHIDRALVAMVLLMASVLTHQIPPVDLLAVTGGE